MECLHGRLVIHHFTRKTGAVGTKVQREHAVQILKPNIGEAKY